MNALKKRGANIYAELLGYGATDDGYHITAPLPERCRGSKDNATGANRCQV